MQIGTHALVFTGVFDHEGLEKAISNTKTAGFDLIEIPLMNPATFDVKLAAQILNEYDLSVTVSLGLNDSTDLTSSDPAVVAAGETLRSDCLKMLHTMCGAHRCGVIYSAKKKYMEPVTSTGQASSAAAILSRTLGIWRNLWQDSDDLAAHANIFIRGQLRAVSTIALHQEVRGGRASLMGRPLRFTRRRVPFE